MVCCQPANARQQRVILYVMLVTVGRGAFQVLLLLLSLMMIIIHIIVIFVVVFTIPVQGPPYQRHFVNFPPSRRLDFRCSLW